MNITVVFNAEAGDQEPGKEAVARELERAGYDAKIVGSRKARWKKILENPGEFLVVAGGDGTIGKAARRAAGQDVAVAILPVGTANNVARALGIPVTLRAAIASWKRSRPLRIDLGVVAGAHPKKDEKVFLEGVGLGLLADSFRAASSAGESGSLTPDRAGREFLRTLAAAKPSRFRIRIDGRESEEDALLVEVLNFPAIGPRLLLAPGADPSDGMLDVVIAGEEHRRALEACFRARVNGRRKPLDLPCRRGREVEIRPARPGGRVHVDGKVHELRGGRPRLRVSIQPCGVRLLMPVRRD